MLRAIANGALAAAGAEPLSAAKSTAASRALALGRTALRKRRDTRQYGEEHEEDRPLHTRSLPGSIGGTF